MTIPTRCLLPLLALAGLAGGEALSLPITFDLEKSATVTVVIEDGEGRRVSNLASAVRLPPGKAVFSWDGYDDGEVQADGSTIRRLATPGTYRAHGVTSDGLRLIYEFPFNSPGHPPWFTKERNGAWLADHTSGQAVVFAPAADDGFLGRGQDRLIVCAKTAECGDAFMALDQDGRKLIGNNDFGWDGGYGLAIDRGPQAPKGADDPWLYSLMFGGKEVSLLVFSRSGKAMKPFKQQVQKPYVWNGGVSGDSLSAWNGRVVISVPQDGVLLVVDPLGKKKLIGAIEIPDPRGVLFDSQGRLLVATATQVRRLTIDLEKATVGTDEVLVAAGLEDAQQLTLDRAGNLYVGDWGRSHQIRVFSPTGKPLRTIGKPGGPQLGPFDAERLHRPKGLAIDSRDQLWVVDCEHLPKRITTWSSADGKLLKTFVGGPGYGGGGTLDPEDPTRVFFGFYDGGYTMKLDWTTGTYAVDSVFLRDKGKRTKPDRDNAIGAVPEDVHRVGGHTFLVPNFANALASNNGIGMIWNLGGDGIAEPVALVGGLHLQEPSHGSWNPARNPGVKEFFDSPGDGKKLGYSDLVIWSDRNRDGRASPDEFAYWRTTVPYIGGNPRFNADLSFTTHGFAFPAPTILPNGVPVWSKEPGLTPLTGADVPDNTVATDDGWVLHVGRDFRNRNQNLPGRHNAILGWHDGKRLWEYPSLAGQHIPTNPGTIVMAQRYLGMPFKAQRGEAGTVFGINGERGTMYLMTSDGLFLQDVGGDMRVLPTIGQKYPEAKRGMVVAGVSFHDEHYGPRLAQTKAGEVILLAGKEFSAVFRVDGLQAVKRRTFATVTLDAARLAGLPPTIVVLPRKQGRQTLPVAVGGLAPKTDGDLADWPASTVWAKLDDRASAAVRIVGDRLHAAWRTGDPAALANAPGEPTLAFKRGGSVDLMLATDPKAPGNRVQPATGDLRLLATMQAGRSIAVLYRSVVPGTAETARVPFISPVGRVDFDRVEVVSTQVQLAQRGGDIELSVPLSLLGLQAAEGVVLRGDLGLLRGSGAVTTQRLYWNNLDTAICSDVPSEARLAPANWGLFSLFPASQAEVRQAVTPPETLTAGLRWMAFEADKKDLADLAKLTPRTRGTASAVELKPVTARATDFAVVFEGFIDLPSTGMWSFSADANDAVRVVVGGRQVLDADLARSGSLTGTPFALAKGLHPLRVEFRQYGGTAGLRLDWNGPEGEGGPIPATAFKREP
jgi:hypothetical protein